MIKRIIFCGDRTWSNIVLIRLVMGGLKANFGKFIVLEGGARGADILAKRVAEELGLKVKEFPANWTKNGRAAGPIRNAQMVNDGKASGVIAFHNDIASSKGTKHMLIFAKKKKLPTWLCTDGYEDLLNFITEIQISK